jgi:sugar phosphate isomerase/epimerase
MRFGAPVWPFQWEPPYGDAIRRIAASGFTAVELIAWNRDTLRDYYTAAEIATLKSVLDGEGIALSQFVSTPLDLSHPDAAKREAAVDHFRRAIEVGVGLGSPIVNSVSSWPFALSQGSTFPRIVTKPLVQSFGATIPSGLDWDRNYRDYVDAVRRCAAACVDAGVVYTIEAHPFAYVANTAAGLRLLEHVGSPALAINFDPSHTFPIGDFPNVSIYQLGAHVRHVHASDNDGVTNVHWRPGRGKIDWRAMFQALKDVGYDGVVSIELEDVPGVSRGPSDDPGVYRNKTATDEFVAETVAGADYLKGICRDLGIRVD